MQTTSLELLAPAVLAGLIAGEPVSEAPPLVRGRGEHIHSAAGAAQPAAQRRIVGRAGGGGDVRRRSEEAVSGVVRVVVDSYDLA
jgi:hypothetical protein